MIKNKPLTIQDYVKEIVTTYKTENALAYLDETPLNYEQLGRRIDATIAYLEDLEIHPGDKVIIYSQNMPNWGVVYLALLSMGTVAVPVLPDFNTHELENVIKHSEAKAIFISESLQYKFDKIKEKTIDIIIRIDDFSSSVKGAPTFDVKNSPKQSYSADENALSVLLYTSGTTGNSKGVMLSQKNLLTNVYQSGAVHEIKPHSRTLSILPLSHTYENTIGLLLQLYKGAFITYLRKPPTASVLLPALKKVKPTLMLTVPIIIEKVYKNSVLPQLNKKFITRTMLKFRPTQKLLHRVAGKKLMETFGGELSFFGVGGAKLDGETERFLRDGKFPVAIGYGLTETAPLVAGANPQNGKLQAIGPKVIDSELKIDNPNPQTGEGEILYRGDNVMLGYYKNEEATQEVLSEDGWFRTGDLGYIDKDGYLYHRGRLKNMIVGANGENIYPEDIEALINSFEFVEESVVIEKKGRLVALVHFNMDELESKFQDWKSDISHKIEDLVAETKKEVQHQINARVNKSSKIQSIEHQKEPFQKTATKKIKRYLYKQQDDK